MNINELCKITKDKFYKGLKCCKFFRIRIRHWVFKIVVGLYLKIQMIFYLSTDKRIFINTDINYTKIWPNFLRIFRFITIKFAPVSISICMFLPKIEEMYLKIKIQNEWYKQSLLLLQLSIYKGEIILLQLANSITEKRT